MTLYIELTGERVQEILDADGADSLNCSHCTSPFEPTRYEHEPAYLAESGDILCWDCSHCFECGEELLRLQCMNSDCRLYLKRATNPKKDSKSEA